MPIIHLYLWSFPDNSCIVYPVTLMLNIKECFYTKSLCPIFCHFMADGLLTDLYFWCSLSIIIKVKIFPVKFHSINVFNCENNFINYCDIKENNFISPLLANNKISFFSPFAVLQQNPYICYIITKIDFLCSLIGSGTQKITQRNEIILAITLLIGVIAIVFVYFFQQST